MSAPSSPNVVPSHQPAKGHHLMEHHGLRNHLSPRLTRQLVGQTKYTSNSCCISCLHLSCIQMLEGFLVVFLFFFFFFINEGYWTCHLWPAPVKFKQQACGKLERGTAISWSLSNALRRIKFKKKKKSYLLQKESLHTSFGSATDSNSYHRINIQIC